MIARIQANSIVCGKTKAELLQELKLVLLLVCLENPSIDCASICVKPLRETQLEPCCYCVWWWPTQGKLGKGGKCWQSVTVVLLRLGGKHTIIPEICTGMLITHRTRVDEKKFTSSILWNADLTEISNAVGMYDWGLNIHGYVIWGIYAEGLQLWQLNIVTVLENWSHLEVQGFIHFLWTRKVPAVHIHWQFIEVYGDDVMSGQQVAMVLHISILQGQCDEWQLKWVTKLLYDVSVLHMMRY